MSVSRGSWDTWFDSPPASSDFERDRPGPQPARDLAAARVRLIEIAVEILGSEDVAERWLLKPSRAISGEPPISRLDTPSGVQQITELLYRIEHSLYS